MRTSSLLWLPPLLLTGLLAACSGKATDSADASGPTVHQPTAVAGSNFSVSIADTLTLSGAGSTDPQGGPLSFQWTVDHAPEGSAIPADSTDGFSANGSADAQSTTFAPDIPGTWVFKLVVTDEEELKSEPAFVVVTVTPPANAPVANAGTDITTAVGARATLDGSGSTDPSGRSLTYAWTLLEKPTGSSVSGLADAAATRAGLTPDVRGLYVVALTVNNGYASSAPDVATVIAFSDDGVPVANAGPDFAAEDCSAIALNGSGSADPEGSALTYQWDIESKPATSTASNRSFSDRASATPSFYADVAGTYVLRLAVNDGGAWSSPDLVTITVTDRSFNTPPVVNAGADQAVTAPTTSCTSTAYGYECNDCAAVNVDVGSDVTISDPEGDAYTTLWRVSTGSGTVSSPSEATTRVSLSGATTTAPGVCTDTTYTIELAATDCTSGVGADTLTVTVSCCAASAATIR